MFNTYLINNGITLNYYCYLQLLNDKILIIVILMSFLAKSKYKRIGIILINMKEIVDFYYSIQLIGGIEKSFKVENSIHESQLIIIKKSR